MSISFPLNLLETVGFADMTFTLVSRQELSSRSANGVTVGKDFGPALWLATYVTTNLLNDDAVDIEALIDTLDGVVQPFEAFDLRRPWPRAHKDGSAADGVLQTVNANNKAMVLSGLNVGQIVSRGDYLSFSYGTNRALHRISETVVADGDGVTPEFEVRPHLRPGFEVGVTVVNLKAPRGIFKLLPQSVVPRMVNGKTGSITFKAGQHIE